MRTSRSFTTRGVPLFAAALFAAAAGCGKAAEEPAPTPPAASTAKTPRPTPPRPTGGGGGGGASSGGGGAVAGKPEPTPEGPPKEMELRILLRNRVVARGEPIQAMIELVNISTEPQTIVDGRADLAMRTRFLVRRGDADVSAGPGLPAGNSIARKQDVVLAPGDGLSAEIDLLPALEDTLSYAEGRVRFVLEFQGDSVIAKGGLRGWNTDPAKKARSKQFDLEVRLPDWLVDLGATDAVYAEMSNAAATFQAGVPGADKTAEALRTRGASAFGCLLLLTRGMGGMDDLRAESGRRAFALLRTIGEPALAALSRATPGDDPAMQMTLGVLLADHDERSGLPPDHEIDKTLRTVSSGETDAGMFDIRFTATTAVPPGSWSIGGHGVLALEHAAGDDVKRSYVQIPVDLLVQLKKSLIASRFAAWRHCRRVEMADEGSVTFTLFRGEKELHRVTLSEQEAFHANPLAVALLDSFRQVATSPLLPNLTK